MPVSLSGAGIPTVAITFRQSLLDQNNRLLALIMGLSVAKLLLLAGLTSVATRSFCSTNRPAATKISQRYSKDMWLGHTVHKALSALTTLTQMVSTCPRQHAFDRRGTIDCWCAHISRLLFFPSFQVQNWVNNATCVSHWLLAG